MRAYLVSVKKVGVVDLVFQVDDFAKAMELEDEWREERVCGAPKIQEEVATSFLMDREFYLMDIQTSDRTRIEIWMK